MNCNAETIGLADGCAGGAEFHWIALTGALAIFAPADSPLLRRRAQSPKRDRRAIGHLPRVRSVRTARGDDDPRGFSSWVDGGLDARARQRENSRRRAALVRLARRARKAAARDAGRVREMAATGIARRLADLAA